MLCGIGIKTSKTILSLVKSPEYFFCCSTTELKDILGLSEKIIRKLNRSKALEKADVIIKQHNTLGVKSVFIQDENYPLRLKECSDAPIMLYYKGELDLNHGKFVAIVGMRDASSYGKRICHALIKQFQGVYPYLRLP